MGRYIYIYICRSCLYDKKERYVLKYGKKTFIGLKNSLGSSLVRPRLFPTLFPALLTPSWAIMEDKLIQKQLTEQIPPSAVVTGRLIALVFYFFLTTSTLAVEECILKHRQLFFQFREFSRRAFERHVVGNRLLILSI